MRLQLLFKEEYLSEWDKLNQLWSKWEVFAHDVQNKGNIPNDNVHDLLQERQQILLV